MYRLYLKQNGEQLLLPVTPAEIETRTGNRNKTAYILDFGEMNLAKKPGLTEIRFTALLPGRAYSFVQTEGGFREPEYFLNRFKEYKASAKPVQMILFRRLADGKQKFCGNTEVLLEEYTVTEKGGEQGDFWVEKRDCKPESYLSGAGAQAVKKKGENGDEYKTIIAAWNEHL